MYIRWAGARALLCSIDVIARQDPKLKDGAVEWVAGRTRRSTRKIVRPPVLAARFSLSARLETSGRGVVCERRGTKVLGRCREAEQLNAHIIVEAPGAAIVVH